MRFVCAASAFSSVLVKKLTFFDWKVSPRQLSEAITLMNTKMCGPTSASHISQTTPATSTWFEKPFVRSAIDKSDCNPIKNAINLLVTIDSSVLSNGFLGRCQGYLKVTVTSLADQRTRKEERTECA